MRIIAGVFLVLFAFWAWTVGVSHFGVDEPWSEALIGPTKAFLGILVVLFLVILGVYLVFTGGDSK